MSSSGGRGVVDWHPSEELWQVVQQAGCPLLSAVLLPPSPAGAVPVEFRREPSHPSGFALFTMIRLKKKQDVRVHSQFAFRFGKPRRTQ